MVNVPENDIPPEPDKAEGAPHPRHTDMLFGQSQAEETFLNAFTSQRLHHGWLLTGPKGIGKATFAWRAARFLLTQPSANADDMFGAPAAPTSLDTDPNHPVARRIQALSDPGLFLLRRPWNEKTKKLSAQITVDAVRALHSFFHMSASGAGRRVVIVDAADDMNTAAANALLKVLEEPPSNTTLFLIANQPARLLPTIRSRCRTLAMPTLSPDDLGAALTQASPDISVEPGLHVLAEGSIGAAIRLVNGGGLPLYLRLTTLWSGRQFDRGAALKLAEGCAGAANAETYTLTVDLLAQFLARLARSGVMGPPSEVVSQDEAQLLTRLCPHDLAARAWANLAATLSARIAHARAVNLDPAAVILDTLHAIDAEAQRWAS